MTDLTFIESLSTFLSTQESNCVHLLVDYPEGFRTGEDGRGHAGILILVPGFPMYSGRLLEMNSHMVRMNAYLLDMLFR